MGIPDSLHSYFCKFVPDFIIDFLFRAGKIRILNFEFFDEKRQSQTLNHQVSRMTTKVINKIKFLCGKGVPSCKVSGIERAAARETTPRIPVQPIKAGTFQPGFCRSATVMKLRIIIVMNTASENNLKENGSTPQEI